MKDSILRGIYGLFWSWPMYELLRWLEDSRLVMFHPLLVLAILGAWMIPGWLVYGWLWRMFDFKGIVWRISRSFLKRRFYND
jgi:hypothetical protein